MTDIGPGGWLVIAFAVLVVLFFLFGLVLDIAEIVS